MMWIFILLGMAALGLTGFLYVGKRLTRFGWIRNKFGARRAYPVSLGFLAAVMVGLYAWGGIWNAAVCFIHLLLFWLVCDGLFWAVQRSRKKKSEVYWAGIAAIAVTVCYTAMAIFFAAHVYRTAYTVEAGTSLRIVGFSDSHMGTVFRADKLRQYVEDMNRENPDIVVIVGDFVDDGTGYDEMVQSCAALSGLQAKYGVYYVFGNHDCGYSNYRGYGKAELVEHLEKNNVIILEDAVVPIIEGVSLCGRQDSQQRSRMSMADLAQNNDDFLIVLDHEPNDQYPEAEAGADLVLSGHTHGGQFFPINAAGEWIGANDMTYGSRTIGTSRFIVSSGIADWAFKMKTGCISEYFVVDCVE